VKLRVLKNQTKAPAHEIIEKMLLHWKDTGCDREGYNLLDEKINSFLLNDKQIMNQYHYVWKGIYSQENLESPRVVHIGPKCDLVQSA
jgi:hypothetical protein